MSQSYNTTTPKKPIPYAETDNVDEAASPSSFSSHALTWSAVIALFSGVAFIRVLVGYQPHSGQDNYHGAHGSYGGDFEAQRHWMELTWHLPIGLWYWYDLYYWGLDYPPLSAYLSWICGGLSSVLVGPESVALEKSRGYEDPIHKSFMRATVLITDLLFYGSIVWLFTKTISMAGTQRHTMQSAWFFVFVMLQPAILLIDHGHFQYNTTALGLALWTFYFITMPVTFGACVVGSIFFCCALSFKQMTLYYAPAVFFYLLGRCFQPTIISEDKPDRNLQHASNKTNIIGRFITLGVTVIFCFVIIWWPFVAYGPSVTSYSQRAIHIIRRIIPLQRGLFEGKVSNLWCALSVKPIRIRDRIPPHLQPTAALALTLLMLIPCCVRVFAVGRRVSHTPYSTIAQDWMQNRSILLWTAASSALSFFLASFQVHEKSLLMAMAPISLLWEEDATFSEWFSIVTAWTLWPLMQLDRLQTAYSCTILIFVSFIQLHKIIVPRKARNGFFEQYVVLQWIPTLCYFIMISLHMAEIVITPPDHLPDLHVVINNIVGCGFCCLAWLVTCWHLYRKREPSVEVKVKLS